VKPRTKASLVWGVVGALVFLVGVQGFRLLTGEGATLGVAVGVAVLVGVAAAAGTYLLDGRLSGAKEQS
jgi:hypothetical protein